MKQIQHIAALPANIQKRIDKLALKAANQWIEQARASLTGKMQATIGKPEWEADRLMARLESAPVPKFQGWRATIAPNAKGCRISHFRGEVQVSCAAVGCPGGEKVKR